MEEYTLEFFAEHYLAKRNINRNQAEQITEAFYAGAQTSFLMMLNSMQSKDLDLLKSLEHSLALFKAKKEAENNQVFN